MPESRRISESPINIFWFRRDLRLNDNAGLYNALKAGTTLPIFIFDTDILEKLPDTDQRVQFIHSTLVSMNETLSKLGSGIKTFYGKPEEVFAEIISKYNVKAVYTNNDYEPAALLRDKKIEALHLKKDIPFHSFKDQVIFEKNEVTKDDGSPYTIFTPYSKKWRAALKSPLLQEYKTDQFFRNLHPKGKGELHSLKSIGFKTSAITIPASTFKTEIIRSYRETRDIPSVAGTSRLSVHLRFGTVSIRELVSKALNISDTWINELIWREFYMMILFHFPHVVKEPFKKQYSAIRWRNNEEEFKAWCTGTTGYPIVDAGMRELNETGFMHNRLRMITASFLTKHLLVDWRWGEAYFAEKLLDYDLAANNGGWQWAASTGCDAVPYFRIFNPYEQERRFDPERTYILRWVPELETAHYPEAIVEHKFARERAISVYKEAANSTR